MLRRQLAQLQRLVVVVGGKLAAADLRCGEGDDGGNLVSFAPGEVVRAEDRKRAAQGMPGEAVLPDLEPLLRQRLDPLLDLIRDVGPGTGKPEVPRRRGVANQVQGLLAQ